MADNIIGIKELHRNLKRVADRALKGERFTVIRGSKPVFRIEPTGLGFDGTKTKTVEDFFALKFHHPDPDLSKKIDQILYVEGDRR